MFHTILLCLFAASFLVRTLYKVAGNAVLSVHSTAGL